jgi:hypothetical protein
VSLNAILAWHRADKPRFQECAPLVDQTAVTTIIILGRGRSRRLGQTSSLTPKTLLEPGQQSQDWA